MCSFISDVNRTESVSGSHSQALLDHQHADRYLMWSLVIHLSYSILLLLDQISFRKTFQQSSFIKGFNSVPLNHLSC